MVVVTGSRQRRRFPVPFSRSGTAVGGEIVSTEDPLEAGGGKRWAIASEESLIIGDRYTERTALEAGVLTHPSMRLRVLSGASSRANREIRCIFHSLDRSHPLKRREPGRIQWTDRT